MLRAFTSPWYCRLASHLRASALALLSGLETSLHGSLWWVAGAHPPGGDAVAPTGPRRCPPVPGWSPRRCAVLCSRSTRRACLQAGAADGANRSPAVLCSALCFAPVWDARRLLPPARGLAGMPDGCFPPASFVHVGMPDGCFPRPVERFEPKWGHTCAAARIHNAQKHTRHHKLHVRLSKGLCAATGAGAWPALL